MKQLVYTTKALTLGDFTDITRERIEIQTVALFKKLKEAYVTKVDAISNSRYHVTVTTKISGKKVTVVDAIANVRFAKYNEDTQNTYFDVVFTHKLHNKRFTELLNEV